MTQEPCLLIRCVCLVKNGKQDVAKKFVDTFEFSNSLVREIACAIVGDKQVSLRAQEIAASLLKA